MAGAAVFLRWALVVAWVVVAWVVVAWVVVVVVGDSVAVELSEVLTDTVRSKLRSELPGRC